LDIPNVEEKAAFFTPKSFADGVVNNGLGVVGFVKEADCGGVVSW
jgi:hypothetical protein